MDTLKMLGDLTVARTYAKTKEDGTKESWVDISHRYLDMMIERFPHLTSEIQRYGIQIINKKIVPSMRLFQFSNVALKQNIRAYNCSFLAIDCLDAIKELPYLLACGCGVGISVMKMHTEQLDRIVEGYDDFYCIGDDKESWAESFKMLMLNPKIEFDYSLIRPAGSLLSSGGTASGPESLRIAHEQVRPILQQAVGRKLKPIELFDIVCYISNVIVSGGVRRSAIITLFDSTDEDMLNAKTGKWYEENPQRGMSNNSAIIFKDENAEKNFNNVMDHAMNGWGEPAVVWHDPILDIRDFYGVNPCCLPSFAKVYEEDKGLCELADVAEGDNLWDGEKYVKVLKKWSTGIKPVFEYRTTKGRVLSTEDHPVFQSGKLVEAKDAKSIDYASLPFEEVEHSTSEFHTAKVVEVTNLGEHEVFDIMVDSPEHRFWTEGCLVHNCEISLKSCQLCNLTEVIVPNCFSVSDFLGACEAASFFGTLQSALTDFSFLRPVWKQNAENEPLLGVSLTGVAQSELITSCNLEYGAMIVKNTNHRYCNLVGTKPALRLTCVKPSGCQKPSTLINTTQGLLRLDEIGKTDGSIWQDISLSVSQEISNTPATKFFVNGKVKTKCITTTGGVTLESTPNHMYKIMRGDVYDWVRADEIKEGDIIPYRTNCWDVKETPKMIPVEPRKSKGGAFLWDGSMYPKEMNEEIAYFLGAFYGDGSVHTRGVRLTLGYKKQHIVDKIVNTIEKHFGFVPKIVNEKNKNCNAIYITSTIFKDFLSINKMIKGKSNEISIPEIIRRSPKTIVLSFIEGFLDTDGHRTNEKMWSAATTSKVWADEFLVLCRSVGVDCKYKEMKVTKGHKGSLPVYQFTSRNILNVQDRRKYRLQQRCILEKLERLGLTDFNYDTVVCIEDGFSDTYDIEVPSGHMYLANSYVSHNTTSASLGTTSGVHAAHAEYYIRRIRAPKDSPLGKHIIENFDVHQRTKAGDFFERLRIKTSNMIGEKWVLKFWKPNFHFAETDTYSDSSIVLSVPCHMPNTLTRDEGVLSLLNRSLMIKKSWIDKGHMSGTHTHNVSLTATYKKSEKEDLRKWMWDNRDSYRGISIFPDTGSYLQAPFEMLDRRSFEKFILKCPPVDVSKIVYSDNTRMQQAACSGGSCEVTF